MASHLFAAEPRADAVYPAAFVEPGIEVSGQGPLLLREPRGRDPRRTLPPTGEIPVRLAAGMGSDFPGDGGLVPPRGRNDQHAAPGTLPGGRPEGIPQVACLPFGQFIHEDQVRTEPIGGRRVGG